MESYQKMKEKYLKNLTDTAKDLFNLLSEFGKLKKQKQQMKIVVLADQLQELTTDTYGIFQLYSYKNLFEQSAGSKIIDDEFLTKQTVATLLNEIFSANKEANEEKNEDICQK